MAEHTYPNAADEVAKTSSPDDMAQVKPGYSIDMWLANNETLEGDADHVEVKILIMGKTADEIQKRNNGWGNFLEDALGRYYECLAVTRQTLASKFSDNEIGLMLEASMGVLHGGAWAMTCFHGGIEDAIEFGDLDCNWGVDGEALVAKLNELDCFSLATLIDAIECWWGRHKRGENPQIEDCLAENLGPSGDNVSNADIV